MSDENGFEWRGRFYRWHVSDIGKDLMLIDRIAQMPVSAFMELVGDADENERAPVLLALVATSIRAGHPEWSVDRIYRTVMNLSIGDDIEFVYTGDQEQETMPGPTGQPPSEPGRSASNGSSSLSTPAASSTSETSSGIPA